MTEINSLPVDNSPSSRDELSFLNKLFNNREGFNTDTAKKTFSEFKFAIIATIMAIIFSLASGISFLVKIVAFFVIFYLIQMRWFSCPKQEVS